MHRWRAQARTHGVGRRPRTSPHLPLAPILLLSRVQIPRLRPTEYKQIAQKDRTVSRPYGGYLCAGCTRERVLRAFIVDEQRVLRKLLQERARQTKTAAPAATA